MITHHHPTPVSPKRVIILGAAGFVARDLARHLAVLRVNYLAVGSSQIDLCQPECVEKLRTVIQPDDALVMTSALTPDKGKDVRTFMKNLSMMSNLCAFLESARCAHVIYLSSDAVYEDAASLVCETTSLSPGGLYGLMHVAREQMLASVLGKLQIPFCVVRSCAIYGASDTHNGYGPNRFLRTTLADRRIILFGNGEEQRDHVYIKDVSRLLGICLHQKSAGVVNLVSGRSICFRELAQCITALIGRPVQIEFCPRATPITHRHFDISLRLQAFPNFHSTPLATGLAETFKELSAPPVV